MIQAPRSDCLRGCRVLVLEDEYLLADDLKQALTLRGAAVVGPIGNLAEASEQVGRDGFDVAVIDVNLNGKTAYAIADQSDCKGIPFVFTTGYSKEVIPARFRNVIRWEKPYNPEQIICDVAKLCPMPS